MLVTEAFECKSTSGDFTLRRLSSGECLAIVAQRMSNGHGLPMSTV